MINFKQRDEMLPSAVILISIVILVGTLLYMILVPTPRVPSSNKGALMRRTMRTETRLATDERIKAETAIAPLLWRSDPVTISTAVLAYLTDVSNKNGVKMSAFRPQKSQDLTGITELPYTVELSGSYAQVHAVVAGIDNTKGRVALRSVEIAVSGAAKDTVTATLSLSAYALADSTLLPAPAKGGAHAKS